MEISAVLPIRSVSYESPPLSLVLISYTPASRESVAPVHVVDAPPVKLLNVAPTESVAPGLRVNKPDVSVVSAVDVAFVVTVQPPVAEEKFMV